jgi:polyferredoxin
MKKNYWKSLRLAIQLGFLLLVGFFVFSPFILGERSLAEGLCPFGGLETLPYLLVNGAFLNHTNTMNIGVIIALAIVTLIFGRLFCSFICPLGTLQEWFGRLGRKFNLNIEIPRVVDGILSKLKYAIFILIILGTYITVDLIFRSYDPFYALFHLANPAINASFAIFGLTLVGSIFIPRIWCRYLCPLGAFVNLLSFISLTKPVRSQDKCIDCGLCDKACATNSKPSQALVFDQNSCNHCLDCVDACPSKIQAISLKAGLFNKNKAETMGVLNHDN